MGDLGDPDREKSRSTRVMISGLSRTRLASTYLSDYIGRIELSTTDFASIE